MCVIVQVFTIATVGVTLSDDTVQQVTDICTNSWVDGEEHGWYRVDSGCGKSNQWNTFTSGNGLYGYHVSTLINFGKS